MLPNFDRVVAYDLTGTEVDAFPIGDSTVAAVDVAGGAAVVVPPRRDRRPAGAPARRRASSAPARSPSSTTAAARPITNVDQVGLVRTFTADGRRRHHLDRWAVGEATAVDVGADGAFALATSTGAVRVLDPAGGAVEAVLDRPQGAVSDVSIAPASGVATGVSVQKGVEAWDDTIEVTDLAVPTAGFSLGGEAENVTGCSFYAADVVFSPDGACSRRRPTTSPSRSRRSTTRTRRSCSSPTSVRSSTSSFSPDGTRTAHVGRGRHDAHLGRRRVGAARRRDDEPGRLVLDGVLARRLAAGGLRRRGPDLDHRPDDRGRRADVRRPAHRARRHGLHARRTVASSRPSPTARSASGTSRRAPCGPSCAATRCRSTASR